MPDDFHMWLVSGPLQSLQVLVVCVGGESRIYHYKYTGELSERALIRYGHAQRLCSGHLVEAPDQDVPCDAVQAEEVVSALARDPAWEAKRAGGAGGTVTITGGTGGTGNAAL